MARNDAERDLITLGKLTEGEACCQICYLHYTPFDPEQEERYVHCVQYDTSKRRSYFCKAWGHQDYDSCTIAPFWCDPHSKKRRTAQEIAKFHSPGSVKARLSFAETNGNHKRAAEKFNGKPRPTIADVVKLQKIRDQRFNCLIAKLEAMPQEKQYAYGNKIKAEMCAMDAKIQAMRKELI